MTLRAARSSGHGLRHSGRRRRRQRQVGGVLDGYRLAKGLGHHRTALTPHWCAQDRSHLSPLPKGVKTKPHYSAAGPGGAGGEPRRNSSPSTASAAAIFEISRYAIVRT
ncbi:MAG: hypothetical protein ACLUIX_04710 [Oscillospiraceae bacterium]